MSLPTHGEMNLVVNLKEKKKEMKESQRITKAIRNAGDSAKNQDDSNK